jgi:hypothetical protein
MLQSTQSGNDRFLAYMMEELAQSGVSISTITYKFVVYAPAERADTLPLFLRFPYMYSVVQRYTVLCTVYFVQYCTVYTPHNFSLTVLCLYICLPTSECECGKANTKEPILLSASPWKAGRNCTVLYARNFTTKNVLYIDF